MHEGYVDVPGGRVWYGAIGDGDGVPLLVLHGGPGGQSLLTTGARLLADERRVIFYDQLGCGRSDRPDDPSLWTVARAVEEVAAVRRGLGLDHVHLLGHSWGGMLALEYLLEHAVPVDGLILSSTPVSARDWATDATRLRGELPADVQATLDRLEAEGRTDTDEYIEAMMVFARRYICRLDPWPDELMQSFQNTNRQIYGTMWGPSEFTVTGTLRDWEVASRLDEIAAPTLVLGGRHDECRPRRVEATARAIAGARSHIFEHSAHLSWLEEPDEYARVVRTFLRDLEREG